MTHPHHHEMFVAHVREPDGKVVDCIIGTEPGVSVEEAQQRLEMFLSTQPDGEYTIVGFHELQEEKPAPQAARHMAATGSAIAAATSQMVMVMMGIVTLVRIMRRGMR